MLGMSGSKEQSHTPAVQYSVHSGHFSRVLHCADLRNALDLPLEGGSLATACHRQAAEWHSNFVVGECSVLHNARQASQKY